MHSAIRIPATSLTNTTEKVASIFVWIESQEILCVAIKETEIFLENMIIPIVA